MMKKKRINILIAILMTGSMLAAGCAAKEPQIPEGYEAIDPDLEVTNEEVKEVLEEDLGFAQSVPYEEDKENPDDAKDSGEAPDSEVSEEPEEEYLPGYKTEEDWKSRNTGSASYLWEPTVVVSIFVDEEEDLWTDEERQVILNLCNIGYGFIEETMADKYDTDCEFIYDWTEDPQLRHDVRVFETIPTYVGKKEEAHVNDLARKWIDEVSYRDLCLKYNTTSIAFLYLIPHEGGSYSEFHCVEDSSRTWNDGSIMYLQDIYSDTYEYETPTVFAHEMLHLFGAEDFYPSAGIYSEETYDTLATLCKDDIMLRTFATIDGVYTTFPDEVYGEISPVTAYLLGIGDESAVSEVPELIREEAGCFPGTSAQRAFED